jgi:hypothetical protein
MIRTCPKCGDYYADDLLAFCLVDGTPLEDVVPLSENWSEGVRVIEEKEQALRKQKRRLKWHRILLRSMTLLIAVMVVCVVVVNGILYLKPRPEEEQASVQPSPQIVTPAPTMEPIADETISPTPDTNSQKLSPTPTPTPKCSVADKGSEEKAILEKYRDAWKRNIEGEKPKIIAENMPVGVANPNMYPGFPQPEATLDKIEYESRFPKACTASVTAKYVWQVRKSINGMITVVPVRRGKRFTCVKTGETWRCR